MRKILSVFVAVFVTVVLALAGLVVASGSAGAASPVPSCKGALLHVTHARPDGAAGHGFLILRFRNISQSTCSLRGYPGFDALKKNGHVLKHARRTLNGMGGAKKVKTIKLAPNALASAEVEWLNFNGRTGGDCAFSHSIAVTPANTSRTVHFRVHVSKCDLQVHPTVKGKTGQG